MRTALPALVIATFLTGCVCNRIAQVPGARGRIIDADTGHPLAGVAVHRLANKKMTVVTDTNGHFLLPTVLGFRFQPLIPPVVIGPYMITGRVEFASSGFGRVYITNHCGDFHLEPLDLHTIELRRSK